MADLWEAINDPHRRQLVRLLAQGEESVGDLAAHFPVSRSAISQHLLLLVEVGLVGARKEGRNRYYRLEEGGKARLQRMFDTFWSDELDPLLSGAQHENKGGNQ